LRRQYACRIARNVGIELRDDAVDRSLTYLAYRISSLKLARKTHPIANDSAWRCLADFSLAFFVPQGVGLKARLSLLLWGWAVCLLPASIATRLVLWRFAPHARPRTLKHLLTKLRVARA